MAGRIRYAYLEDQAVIFDDDKAFRLSGAHWVPMHLADAMCKAKLLSKAEFEDYAPDAPVLPSTLFH